MTDIADLLAEAALPAGDDPPELTMRELLDIYAARQAEEAAEIEQQAFEAAVEQYAEKALKEEKLARAVSDRKLELSGAVDSWAPEPIADLFDTEQQEPEIGTFAAEDGTDNGGVFYLGKVNEVHGPSESGKTMFVLAVAAQEIAAGRHVVMIDYEDDGRAIVNRLRHVFGMERGQIEKHFHYFRPDTPFGDAGMAHITGIGDVSLCIIDAVTESMAVSGLDGRNENEVATWYNDFPKRLAKTGMGVVLIDHTPQDNSTRQIGSQHKKSAVDGVSYTAEPVYPFVKGQLGHLRIRVAKDKIGSIRQSALPQGEGKQFWRGDFKIDGRPTHTGDRVTLTGVTSPHGEAGGGTSGGGDVKSITLPTPSEAVILEILAESGEWMTAQAICEWHNEQLGPKDPRRLSRTAPRKKAVRLIAKRLVESKTVGTSVLYRVTQDGLHSANAWANRDQEDARILLE